MKIALVHKRYGVDGGTERFAEGLARGLAQLGHEVHVFAASVDPRFARTHTAAFHSLPFVLGGGVLALLTLQLAVAWTVRERDFDAVLHLGRTGPGRLYRAGGGCHRTWAERSGRRSGLGDWLKLRHERRALEEALVVVPSELARTDFLQAYGEVARGVRVLPNGVDLDRFHPKNRQLFFTEVRDQLGLSPEELVLLFVGSDFDRKGLDVAMRAVARLGAQPGEVRLLAVGDDLRRAKYEALAEELGLRSSVTFLRHHERLEHLMAACDALVLPTRHDPFANVTLEALATGLPVVTSGRNGAVEAVPNCAALAVVPDPEDDEGFGQALQAMLDPAGLVRRQGQARQAAQACGDRAAVQAWAALFEEMARG